MGGISSGIPTQNEFYPLEIVVTEKEYRILTKDFDRTATESELQNFTKGVLTTFREIERNVNRTKKIQLTTEECKVYLKQLVLWGRRAYQKFFNEDAQKNTYEYSQLMKFVPIFISEMVTFPWEVLYEGDNEQVIPEMFWGLHYPVARRLNPKKSDLLLEQVSPLNMLFCLHHQLIHAHNKERPEIEEMVKTLGKFNFLRLTNENPTITDGVSLLNYFYQNNYNIFHFACHCRPCKKPRDEVYEVDALQISVIEDESKVQEIELETYNFLDTNGSFQCQPLIFLNACQSAGGFDELRKTFNLPKEFIQRGAAAVIATACPVPDIFAAAFAKKFYEFFIGEKMMIGKALYETRRYFLEEYNNPLGLAYGLYSSPYYRISQLPAVGGFV